MRWVVIVGILVMEFKVLVLDELIVGFDFKGRKELMIFFKNFYKKGMIIVLVIYLMDDVVDYVDYVYVLEVGKVILLG